MSRDQGGKGNRGNIFTRHPTDRELLLLIPRILATQRLILQQVTGTLPPEVLQALVTNTTGLKSSTTALNKAVEENK